MEEKNQVNEETIEKNSDSVDTNKNDNNEEVELEVIEPDDKLLKYYRKAVNSLKKVDNDFSKYYIELTNTGDNKFYQKNITETKFIDETWILTLEGLVQSIDRIIRNPKHTIRYEDDIVVVEKAKKIDSASVRHLASHTGLIRDINRKSGQVTPTKILTRFAEEEIATYENRFVMTLIERLYLFVKARYDIIKDNVESYQHDHLFYTSKFNLKDEEVSFNLDIDIKRDLDNPNINKHNIELLQRANNLMILVTGFKASSFMREMAKAKKVQPPIMKTNVILKNADFRNAYTLWLFLDRYNSLAYDIHVRERPVRLSKEFKGDLDHISALSYSALVNNKKKRQEDFRAIESIEPIVKKSTKMARTNPKDVVKNPDAIEIQDNAVNEYYLLLNKKIMNQKINDLMDHRTSYLQSAKKVVKESIDITNAMFESYFNFEEDVDYFDRFIQSSDPKKVFEKAKEQARIAKAIREAKDSDYKRSIKLEKSLYSAMLKATNERVRAINYQKKQEAFSDVLKQLDKENKQLKVEKERIKKQISILDGKLVDIETGKTNRDTELEQLKIASDEEMNKIKEEAKVRKNTELKKIVDKHNQEMAALKEQMNKELEEAKERRRIQIEQDKEKERIKKEKLKEQLKLKEQKEKELLKKKLNKEKENLKKKHKADLTKVKNAKSLPNKKTEKDQVVVEEETNNEE